MNPAVERLLAERVEQGLPRHVEDESVLAQVAQLLNVKSAGDDTRRPSRTFVESSDARAS
jgi:hypothetical protein